MNDLEKIFRTSLALPADIDMAQVRYRQTSGWDSLAHRQLVGEIETHFNIMLDTQDVLDMSSFAEAVGIVRKYDVDLHAAS